MEKYLESAANIHSLFNGQLKCRGGFNCTLLTNNPKPVQMRNSLKELCDDLRKYKESVGLFFYCGDSNVLEEGKKERKEQRLFLTFEFFRS